jgi:hypothetical protein
MKHYVPQKHGLFQVYNHKCLRKSENKDDDNENNNNNNNNNNTQVQIPGD